MVQGESMAGRFFHRLGASLLDRTICSSAGGEALAATYGAKVGMHVEHYAESRLIVIWGSNSITSNLHFWTLALQAKRAGAKLVCIDPRRTDTAEKCHEHIALLPGSDGALALGVMHELIAQRLARPRLHRSPRRRLAGAARARPAVAAGARRRGMRHRRVEQVRALARDYGTMHAGGDPPQLRHAARARRRQRGAPDRASCRAWSAPGASAPAASCSRRRAGSAPIRDDAALQRPDLLAGRRPRTINMSTIGDDLLRESGTLCADGTPFGPRIEALVVYNSNPVAVAPESARVARGFAREDLFTVVLEHFLTDTADHRRLRAAGDDAARAPRRPHELRPHLRADQRAGDRAARRGEAEHAGLSRARRADGLRRAVLSRRRRGAGADRVSSGDDGRRRFRRSCARRAGSSSTSPRRRSPKAGFRRATASARVDVPGLGVPDHVANYESAAQHARSSRAASRSR